MTKEKPILNRILSKLENIEWEIGGMKEKVGGIEGDVGDIKGEVGGIKGEIAGMKKEIKKTKKETAVAIEKLEKRIDKKMEDRFEAFAIMVKNGFDEVYERMDRVLKRVVSVEKIEKQNSRRILFVENDHRSLETSHNRSLERITRIEQRLERKVV